MELGMSVRPLATRSIS